MLELMITAPASGSGKTILTCALLAALKKRGRTPCAFKCGPDYIDPMFHRSVLGVESHNLDLFLAGEDDVRRLYAKYSGGHGAAVTEGAMGFYDGLGGTTDRASAWHVSDTLGLPVLLALRPKGASLTLAAQVGGLQSFRRESHIAGLFLNDCSTMLAKSLVPMLERETGLPVLGWLPHMEEAVLESRHLGLYTAGEIENLSARIDRAADVLSENLDWDQLDALFSRRADRAAVPAAERVDGVPVAVARDEAFCFAYAETLDALREAGASLRFFSPLGDAALPGDACALYLPGGYPELHAAGLAENADMRRAVRDAVAGGMPTVAECGGFLYLGQTLEDGGGRAYPMAGVLPGEAVRRERLVRFGYAELSAAGASMLFRPGEAAPVHEFHYWDSTENGDGLVARKPLTGRSWQCGFVNEHLYAAFPHLYFAGRPALARRFVRAAEHWRDAHE
ncbi:MAG: cobyrinate a,c-diamide synthase [Oscillospiraceae bacterium]|nr:cobyrinate a,c-diamide synthase [Oscillospiraceae bacterium]